MLIRILEFKYVLQHMAIEYTECVALNNIDFGLIEHILRILSPFEKITKKLSDRNETISSVLPSYFALVRSLESPEISLDQQYYDLIFNFKSTILNGLKNRMSSFLNEKFLILSSVLDPRYKVRFFSEESDKRMAKALLEVEMEILSAPEISSPPTKRSTTQFFDDPVANFLSENDPDGDVDFHVSTSTDGLKLELDHYLSERPISPTSDPLDYWRIYTKSEVLKKLARRFLCPPPSSVESERVFSTLGGIYKPKRSRLSGEHAKQQLFLHHHL